MALLPRPSQPVLFFAISLEGTSDERLGGNEHRVVDRVQASQADRTGFSGFSGFQVSGELITLSFKLFSKIGVIVVTPQDYYGF